MELQEAISLIQYKRPDTTEAQIWADLGCGQGLFTYALADGLQLGSVIYAIDDNLSALKKINSTNKTTIKTLKADFIKDDLELSNLDGILMANSLHYVKDKSAFIRKAIGCMKEKNNFLIVEYDTDKSVPIWVPYPISFTSLKKIFSEAGYTSIKKLHERPSVYNRGNIYSALISNYFH
jgi:ubiquinone/menaquinone biosynthesis C-methylase UbiE